jgi:peptide/nickel transport system ATP-binding protein
LVVFVALGGTAEAKTFRWANDGDPTTMDPHARSDLFVTSFDMNMYEALLRRDRDLKLEPSLATEWSNIDPTTWRFKLRQGVKFHDGTLFTADDVIFSFRRATAPGSDLAGQLAIVKEVKKVDDNTVDFITDGPAPILPNYLVGIAIMSKAWCEAHNATSAAMLNDEEGYATRNADGTGPFMLKDRQPAVRTVLVKNPNWPIGAGGSGPICCGPLVAKRHAGFTTRCCCRREKLVMAEPETVLHVDELQRTFDVSPPALERLLQRKKRATLKAVDGISFSMRRGETFGLVGESGCGKSTVARLIVGLYRPTAGRIVFAGQELARLRSRKAAAPLRRRLQMIFQDPYASLNPRWRVKRIIAEPLRTHQLVASAAALRKRVAELLLQVRLLPADGEKFPHQFSGGQRQRISIARALASNPEFLVCDEPTSALDVSVQAQILNLMKDLQRQLGLTYLFISHNLAVIYQMSDRVGVMYLGRLVEIASAEQLFASPRHPYTRLLLDTIPSIEMTGREREPVPGEVPNPIHPPPGCSFHPRCSFANERCRRERPELIDAGGTLVACHAVEERRLQSAPALPRAS